MWSFYFHWQPLFKVIIFSYPYHYCPNSIYIENLDILTRCRSEFIAYRIYNLLAHCFCNIFIFNRILEKTYYQKERKGKKGSVTIGKKGSVTIDNRLLYRIIFICHRPFLSRAAFTSALISSIDIGSIPAAATRSAMDRSESAACLRRNASVKRRSSAWGVSSPASCASLANLSGKLIVRVVIAILSCFTNSQSIWMAL